MSLTPVQFADGIRDRFLQPAIDDLAGRDNRLQLSEAQRAEPLVGGELLRYFEVTGFQSSAKSRVITATHAHALEAGSAAIEADGTIRDPNRLPAELRPMFLALEPAAPPRFNERVLARIMTQYGLTDREALLAEALRHDDGNGYLKQSELEAAAKVLSGEAAELGIISDLDQTVVPLHDDVLPDHSYPGVAQLFQELEALDGDRSDTTYVTARSPARVVDIPEWLEARGLPAGTIETGINSIPAVAEREKIADISRTIDATPNKQYILFGDSSHRDPEVYRAIRARYPDRITAAFIHKVNDTVSPGRVEGLHLVENYAEAASILLDRGVLSKEAARRVMVAAQLQGLDITDAEIQALLGER